MYFDFVSILLILSLGQSVFLLFITFSSRTYKKLPNILILAILFVLAWYQIEFFMIRNKLDSNLLFLYNTRYGSWLVLGPLIWLYNKSLLHPHFTFKLNHLIHFLPYLLFTWLLPSLTDEFITNRAVDYGMLTVFDNWNREPITWKHYLYGSIFIIQYLHALTYFLLTYLNIKSIEERLPKNQLNKKTSVLNTQKYIVVGVVVVIILGAFFIAIQVYFSIYRRNMDYFYVLPVAILIYGLMYRAIKYPHSVIDFNQQDNKKYEKSGLTEQASKAYLERLEKMMTEEKIYKESNLRLGHLADKVGISTHHLSQLINNSFEQNYFDYINKYRVNEAKVLIEQTPNRNLLDVALEVGFNNKNSFNNAFKKQTGMNPTQFKKQKVG